MFTANPDSASIVGVISSFQNDLSKHQGEISTINASDQKTTHWLLRLLMWDGVLPLVVWACPAFFRWWLKNNEMNVIFTASIIPSVALVVRYYMAMGYIKQNRCGPWTKRFQTYTLRVALVYLVCLESLLIMMQELPELKDIDPGAVLFLVTAYLIYLLPMAFVLYPGKEQSRVSGDLEASETTTNYFGGEEYS